MPTSQYQSIENLSLWARPDRNNSPTLVSTDAYGTLDVTEMNKNKWKGISPQPQPEQTSGSSTE